MNHDVHSTVVICITKLMLQLTMYQTVILSCPDNCQRKGSKNRTNFSYFPQKPAGSPSLCSSPFRPASHFTCFYFLVVACSHFLLVTCFRSCRTARRFAPAAASLRSGTPLRGYPSHSLRSRAPPAHGATGGYAVRRLAAIRLSRREMLTSHDPSFFFQFILSFLYSFRTFPLVALWKADFEERSRKKCRFSPFPPEPFHS